MKVRLCKTTYLVAVIALACFQLGAGDVTLSRGRQPISRRSPQAAANWSAGSAARGGHTCPPWSCGLELEILG
jgi:hypothetical protein